MYKWHRTAWLANAREPGLVTKNCNDQSQDNPHLASSNTPSDYVFCSHLGFAVPDTGLSSVPFVQATSFLLTLCVISSIQAVLPI